MAAVKKTLHLVRGRILANPGEDVTGLVASQHVSIGRLSAPVRAPHSDLPKPRGSGAVPCAHDLLRLSLTAVRRAPKRPLVARTDGIHRIPKFRGNSRVRRILQHAQALAILDLPTHLGAKLKVVAFIVNRPGAVGLEQNAVIGGRNQLLERKRLLAGKNADV